MYRENERIAMWVADMYDMDETDRTDVNFALELIGDEPKSILDIACGSGRFLIPMARAGHRVVGLDMDECMLMRLSDKIEQSDSVNWKKADVIEDDWGKDFDIVLLSANFLFNIVSEMDYEQAQRRMVEKSSGSLISGGHLWIDYGYTYHPEAWFENPNPNVVWEGTDCHGNYGKMILLDSHYDQSSRENRFIRRFEMTFADGEKLAQDIPSKKHFVSLETLEKWLLEMGFSIEGVWGDYEKNAISQKTNRAIIWAKKL